MNITKTLAVASVVATMATTLAFAQTSIPSTYQADLQAAKATLKADSDQYYTDRQALRKAVKANDTKNIASLKLTVANDKVKVNADNKAIELLKKNHKKELGMKEDKMKDDKPDKKDKNGKDIESKDDKMASTTKR